MEIKMPAIHDDDDSIDEYLRYAAKSRGELDDFDSWAEDNRIHNKKKKKLSKQDLDDNSE